VYDGNDPDGKALAVNIDRRLLTKGRSVMVADQPYDQHIPSPIGGAMIGVTRPSVRLKGSGDHLRLRVQSSADPLATVRECCRAATALDKAMAKAVRDAIAAGSSWAEVGQELTGMPGDTPEAVLNAYASGRRSSWSRFWGIGGNA
jgi:hypothetical protein